MEFERVSAPLLILALPLLKMALPLLKMALPLLKMAVTVFLIAAVVKESGRRESVGSRLVALKAGGSRLFSTPALAAAKVCAIAAAKSRNPS
jgi:hypothetical protein